MIQPISIMIRQARWDGMPHDIYFKDCPLWYHMGLDMLGVNLSKAGGKLTLVYVVGSLLTED